MTTFIILLSLYLIVHGAFWGRIDGGGIAKVNEWVERIFVMFLFVLVNLPAAGFYAFVGLLGTFGIATGHGQYFHSLAVRAISPEWFDFLVKPFFGDDPRSHEDFKHRQNRPLSEYDKNDFDMILSRMQDYGLKKLYWRCSLGMFVTGSVVGIVPALIALFSGYPLAALLLSLTGVVKACAYSLGHVSKKVFPDVEETVIAEFTNGAGRNFLCVVAGLIILKDVLF